MKRFSKIVASIALVAGLVLLPTSVMGQAGSDVTQEITGGTLTAAILDSGRNAVSSPSFAMTGTNFSFSCQTSTGTLGSGSQRLYVINPSGTGASTAWALSLAATGPWSAAGGLTYAYNEPAGSGCTSGQLTVNATPGTLTNDCVSSACTSAVVNKGSSTAMSGSTPVTILSAPSGASVYRGYITGVTLSQAIPAEQPAGNYTLPVTLTAAAS